MSLGTKHTNSSGDVYEDRYVAFLDILGFSQLIDASIRDNDLRKRILRLFNSLKDATAPYQSDRIAITVFSDTICISARTPSNFASFCGGMSLMITGQLGMGYAMRGAVSRGALYHQGGVIFGPALIRAYELERRLAFFPRVIVDPQMKIELDAEERRFDPVYRDVDGFLCVNFLSPVLLLTMIELLSLPATDALADLLAQIDQMVLRAPNEAALQKLQWLSAYAHRTIGDSKPDPRLIQELAREIRATMPLATDTDSNPAKKI